MPNARRTYPGVAMVEGTRTSRIAEGAGHADQPIASAIDGPVWPLRRRSAPAGTFDADTVLARLVGWAAEHGDPPRAYDWNPPMARAMGLPHGGL